MRKLSPKHKLGENIKAYLQQIGCDDKDYFIWFKIKYSYSGELLNFIFNNRLGVLEYLSNN
jgi:hypothetical protein